MANNSRTNSSISMRGVSKKLKRLLDEYLDANQVVQFNKARGLITQTRQTPEGAASLVRVKKVTDELLQTLVRLERLAKRPPSLGDYVAVLKVPSGSSLPLYSADSPGVITGVSENPLEYSINGNSGYPVSLVHLIGPATDVSLRKVRAYNEEEFTEEIPDSDAKETASDPFIAADAVIRDLCKPNKGMIQVQLTRTVNMPGAGVRQYYCRVTVPQDTISVCIALKPAPLWDTSSSTALSSSVDPYKFSFYVTVWSTKKPSVVTDFHWSGATNALPSAIRRRLADKYIKGHSK